jgi:excisionase family DNA binding protein
MTATEILPKLLSIDDLADHLGSSSGHVRRLIAERRVPYLKVGGYVRFDLADIAAWLDRAA